MSAAPAMAGKKDGAKATFVKGTVEVGKAEAGPYKKLKRNKRVKAGQFVRTGDLGAHRSRDRMVVAQDVRRRDKRTGGANPTVIPVVQTSRNGRLPTNEGRPMADGRGPSTGGRVPRTACPTM